MMAMIPIAQPDDDTPQACDVRKSAVTGKDVPPAGIDWQYALEQLGSPRIVKVIAEAALEECPRLAAAVRAAAVARDAVQLRLSAHTLKGALRYFGETPAFTAAQSLEKMGCAADFDNAAAACDRLDAALADAIGSMYDYLQKGAADD
jgi:HPt (histidine-containing phosphotransfer) domain-containing protein